MSAAAGKTPEYRLPIKISRCTDKEWKSKYNPIIMSSIRSITGTVKFKMNTVSVETRKSLVQYKHSISTESQARLNISFACEIIHIFR